jgi:PAS domain S-box-containing protein
MLKIISFGTQLMSAKDKSEDMFNKLINIGPSHIRNLIVYSNFLKSILSDDTKSKILFDKANQIIARQREKKKISYETSRIKYGINSTTCIIVVSGNINTMGICLTVNNDIKKIYGYKNSEITGQNINKIMPKAYESLHDLFMIDFFQRDNLEENVLHVERVIYPINKRGYLIPSTIMIKLLPELESDIKIVGFMAEEENFALNKSKVHYMLFNWETGHL